MQKDYVATIYDEKERPKTIYPFLLARYLVDRFSIPAGSLLLDVGCGRGDFTFGFHENGLKTEGLDISEFSAQEFSKNKMKIYVTDIFYDPWPIPDNYADVVFSKSVLEHIHNPDHFMRETYRILKPGGRIITMTPDWETGYRIFYDDHTHVQPYTKRGLRDLLKMFNFHKVAVEQFYQLPVIWKYPVLKTISCTLRCIMPPNSNIKNKFIRWSLDLMCLGTGVK